MNYVSLSELVYRITYDLRTYSAHSYSYRRFTHMNASMEFRIWINWVFFRE